MPRYRPVVMARVVAATACALALAAPASAAYAASAHHAAKPVLTVGKKDGPAVNKRAVLKASLEKGTSVVLALGTTFSATCKSSTLVARVRANLSRPGKATLSVTGESIRRCTLKNPPAGVSLSSIKALNLPYGATIRSAKGFRSRSRGRRRLSR